MESISEKIFRLTKYLHEKLTELHHSNGQCVAQVYRDTDYCDSLTQGGIINFNLMRSNGAYVGYLEVLYV
jgi:molybdenum cofactor sulfurtransferase